MLYEESHQKNQIKTKIQAYNEVGVSLQDILNMVMKDFGLTADEVAKKVKEYLD